MYSLNKSLQGRGEGSNVIPKTAPLNGDEDGCFYLLSPAADSRTARDPCIADSGLGIFEWRLRIFKHCQHEVF